MELESLLCPQHWSILTLNLKEMATKEQYVWSNNPGWKNIILSLKDSQSIIILLNKGLKQWLKHLNQVRLISICDKDPQTSKPNYITDSRDT